MAESRQIRTNFSSVLIANRGEIAVRVIRACRQAGLRAIAVYSDADVRALHLELADEAFRLGPPPPAESYLNVKAILDAARQSGAEAIHPGYGFLSESAEFAERCLEMGLVWIGPAPAAMRLLGDKAAAKALAERVGVPILPGYHGPEQEDVVLRAAAEQVGFPLLVKAAAGGGGRGMRLVERPEQLDEALSAARREARSSFGDDRLLLERYLARPRHVEMQVFGDQHGNVLYLGERDCSIQRRHQKVIEEAPAPRFSESQRREMGAAAVALARAAEYTNAGTVEFLLDEDGRFSFLEMNTRLQVEHPVTELVTGLDLVQLQLELAAGAALPLTQEELRIVGHAIECRVYAEDWASGFLPSTGRLARVRWPLARADEVEVRVDAGVQDGDLVSPHYDPLLAKLIVHGPTRPQAVRGLAQALAATEVGGVRTNLGFLEAVLGTDGFAEGRVGIQFVGEHGLDRPPPPPTDLLLAAVASQILWRAGLPLAAPGPPRQAQELWSEHGPWRLGWVGAEARFLYEEQLIAVGVQPPLLPGSPWLFELAGQRFERRVSVADYPELVISADDGRRAVKVERVGQYQVVTDGRARLRLKTVSGLATSGRFSDGQAATTHDIVRAPMPGRIVKLLVRPGVQVKAHQTLLVLEAMKIEHLVTAPRDGIVEAVRFQEGDQVERGAPLVELED
jgi:3-methylcrotonyl-CoA carboxylase alpha subunit